MDDQDSNKQHQNELEQIEDDDLIRSDEESDSSDEELEENSDMSDNELQDQLDNDESSSKRKRIYIPGQKLPKGTVLVPDESAYVMRHEFGLDSFPAYSFDYIGKFSLFFLEGRQTSRDESGRAPSSPSAGWPGN